MNTTNIFQIWQATVQQHISRLFSLIALKVFRAVPLISWTAELKQNWVFFVHFLSDLGRKCVNKRIKCHSNSLGIQVR